MIRVWGKKENRLQLKNTVAMGNKTETKWKNKKNVQNSECF